MWSNCFTPHDVCELRAKRGGPAVYGWVSKANKKRRHTLTNSAHRINSNLAAYGDVSCDDVTQP